MILLAITLYVLAQLGIAAWAARGTESDDDYLLAGRSLGLWPVAMSVFATWFAAETVIATTGETARLGLAGARVEPFAYGFGLIALALVVAHKIRAGGHFTLAGFLGARFGLRVELVSAIIIALSASVWAAAQLNALAVLISTLADLPFLLSLAIGTTLVLTYTFVGGLKGDVATDVVQGSVIIIGLIFFFVVVLNKSDGVGGIPLSALSFDAEGETLFDKLDVWLVPILGTLVAQEAISRLVGAKSPEVARNGAFLGGTIYIVVGFLPVGIGLLGPTLGLELGEGDAFFSSLAEVVLPTWLFVVISGAILSAILSSVDSALLAASAPITESGIRRIWPNLDSKTRLRSARLATIGVGLCAAAVAASGQSIRDIVLTASEVSSLLLVPTLITLFTPQSGRWPALMSLFVGALSLFVLHWTLGVPGGYLLTLLLGALAYGLTLLVLRVFSIGQPTKTNSSRLNP
ncbi:MAG: hypothetical protein AAFX52_09170 [Pseudomonadota bacterium]